MIENKTDLSFITGDECVPATKFVLSDLETIIPNYYFPINPNLAVRFLEKKELASYVPRKIIDKYGVHLMNRLIYNCSKSYLFSNEERPLRLTTIEPKERSKRYSIFLKKYFQS